jgi:hypothetical protein
VDVPRRERHPDPDPCMRLTEVELYTLSGYRSSRLNPQG